MQAAIQPHGYSLPLQEALADFGAENSFAQASVRLHQRYDIAVPPSAVRTVTLRHGEQPQAEDGTTGRANAWLLSFRKPLKRSPAEGCPKLAEGSVGYRSHGTCGDIGSRVTHAVRQKISLSVP